MIQAFYTSTSGMKASQKTIDVLSNNISNSDTPGYRVKRVEFQQILNQQMGKSNQSELTGYGTKIAGISTMPLPADVNPLGMQISGNGYFALEDALGQRSYTKNGDFMMTNVNGTNYLTTKSGDYVLDVNGNRIQIQGNADSVIFSNGLLYTNGNNGEAGIRVGVVKFDNLQGLALKGVDQYVLTDQSSQPTFNNNASVSSNYYDELSSSVMSDQINEITKIVQTQMAYQFNSKAMQAADEIEGMANHLRY